MLRDKNSVSLMNTMTALMLMQYTSYFTRVADSSAVKIRSTQFIHSKACLLYSLSRYQHLIPDS